MKIGIMQPYFFPYIGYFQLIDAVDVYVNLDHVSFMKRSYMTRNVIKNETPINVQVTASSQNSRCKDVMVNYDHGYIKKFYKTIENLYRKSPNYDIVMDQIVLPSITNDNLSISAFNLNSIKQICNYLEITTTIIETSEGLCQEDSKREKGLKEITKTLDGKDYINAIGGTKLYDKENFLADNINLYFLKTNNVEFEKPYYSILHQLFEYPKDHIKQQIKNYEII